MNRIANKSVSKIWAAAIFLACAAAAPARAMGDGTSHVSIGARAMYFDPKDADDGTWSGGAQLRFHFDDVWAMEGSIDYRRSHYNDTTLVHTYPVQATLIATLIPDAAIRPFILGGAGWYFTSIEGPGVDDTDNRFGLHAGGGLELPLSESWSVDATYRYIWLDNIRTHDSSLLNKEYNDSGSMITAGLNYHFQ